MKIQAVRLALEIGTAKAARELGIHTNTLHTWMHQYRLGNIDLGAGTPTPQSAMTLSEEVQFLRKQLKDQDKEIRRMKEENEFLEEASAFFAACRNERMKFIALKTDDGRITGKIAFYCRMLHASRQGFYKWLDARDRPWKYQDIADAMMEVLAEDECNDTYGRVLMYQTLLLKYSAEMDIPSERAVYRIMRMTKLIYLLLCFLDFNTHEKIID